MNILIFGSSNSSFNSVHPEAEIYIGMVKQGHDVTVVTHGDTEFSNNFKKNGIKRSSIIITGHLNGYKWPDSTL